MEAECCRTRVCGGHDSGQGWLASACLGLTPFPLGWGSWCRPWGGRPGQGVSPSVTGAAQLRTLGAGPLVPSPTFFRRENQDPQRREALSPPACVRGWDLAPWLRLVGWGPKDWVKPPEVRPRGKPSQAALSVSAKAPRPGPGPGGQVDPVGSAWADVGPGVCPSKLDPVDGGPGRWVPCRVTSQWAGPQGRNPWEGAGVPARLAGP